VNPRPKRILPAPSGRRTHRVRTNDEHPYREHHNGNGGAW
jgi:hypothetical protein